MKIELVEAQADRSLHAGHHELWVRVLSPDPLDATAWTDIKTKIDPEVMDRYQGSSPCGFHVDLWDDDDPEHELYGFEQWWIVPSRPGAS